MCGAVLVLLNSRRAVTHGMRVCIARAPGGWRHRIRPGRADQRPVHLHDVHGGQPLRALLEYQGLGTVCGRIAPDMPDHRLS
jgi:hypothetical protein